MEELMKLKQLIVHLKDVKQCRSLSDEYLLEHNYSTRNDMGIGEYSYGIVMVPETWVLPYLEELLKIKEEKYKNEQGPIIK